MASSSSGVAGVGECFICHQRLAEGGEVAIVKTRGVYKLLESSTKRRNYTDKQFLKGVLSGFSQVQVHVTCQKSYNNERMIQAATRRRRAPADPSTIPKPTRSQTVQFDFNNRCFLCEALVTEEYRKEHSRLPRDRRNEMVKVTVPEMVDTILEMTRKREDDWGRKVENRIIQLDRTDLVAVNAQYHRNCLPKFYAPVRKAGQKRGRPSDPNVDEVMEMIYTTLENNSDECQFSLRKLLEEIDEDRRPTAATVKNRLKEKYGDDIVLSESPKGSIISFKNTGHKILYDNWYVNEKRSDPQSERLRIVKAAGEIILEDIRSVVLNTSHYPPIDNFLGSANLLIPASLLLLLHTIILTNKKGSLDSWKKKCAALAHAIMMAVRPRSFLSPIMIAVAVYIYKKFGSKLLVNLLSSLGFSSTYDEAIRLEGSYVLQADKAKIKDSANPFSQFVFDNADFNINTLDGHDTFHAMGGIMSVTPRDAVVNETEVARLKVSSASKLIAEVGNITVQPYHRPSNAGLKNVTVEDIKINCSQVTVPCASEIAWLYGKNSEFSSTVPGWNGFMELATSREQYECSKIVCLPFINAPPSDFHTVYTSILTAIAECKYLNQKTCIITFDQPLYWKARDVVANDAIPELSCVVVRLGGFHLLMSFLGAMGTIMAGTGLKELFCTIYAGNSVTKILSGHAYARAVRAHILTHAALAGLIFKRLEMTTEDLSALEIVINHPDRSTIIKACEDDAFQPVIAKFTETLKKIEQKGPTAALWIQYFRMCTLMKDFIKAERMGNWDLHLECVKEILPYFHAAGHLNYAKSVHLYLQDMIKLQNKMDPEEFDKFTTQGYFTIRRTEKFWSGIWSDMSIEQVLMRAMKSYGGLTRGRGITDSVLSRWTSGMLCLQSICEQVEIFTDTRTITSEQHVDMRPSRVTRDNIDMDKLRTWFAEHPPFLEIKELVSLSTGNIAHEEVNCHSARKIGITCMKKIVGKQFEPLNLKRKDKVVTLASVTCSIKIAGKRVTVDPLTLFQRICITKQSEDDLKELFKYELAPFPMSLFTEEGMRKGTKSTLYDTAFTPLQGEVNFGSRRSSVIDGGYLLHKVVWSKTTTPTFQSVCQTYVHYVKKHFGNNVTVVFDGYPTDISYQSSKAAERARRALLHTSTTFIFSSETPVTVAQENFLSNDTNKTNLIIMLMVEMAANGIEVKQAIEDADVMIVHTAISKAVEYDSVTITGEDVDLLVLLTALAPSSNKNIYFEKSGRGNAPSLLFSAASCKFDPEHILFLHAISGCDTTSAPFGQGKKKMCKLYQQNTSLHALAAVFKDPHASASHIAGAGEKLQLYGGNTATESLNSLRYQLFTKSVVKPKFQLARLPPTTDAATHHAHRTYLQVQTWLGNEILPSVWGWSLTRRGVVPITTSANAAPDNIMSIISCNCKKGRSTAACSCKKAGLLCSTICKNCSGHGCENSPEPDFQEEGEEEDESVAEGECDVEEEESRYENPPFDAKRERF